jgi:hypothetical protein
MTQSVADSVGQETASAAQRRGNSNHWAAVARSMPPAPPAEVFGRVNVVTTGVKPGPMTQKVMDSVGPETTSAARWVGITNNWDKAARTAATTQARAGTELLGNLVPKHWISSGALSAILVKLL